MKCKLDDKENLKELIKTSVNISDVLGKLGYKHSGGLYKTFYKYVKLYNLDISHFINVKRKRTNFRKKDITKILTNEVPYYNSHNLKKYLYRLNLKQPICELCNQDENWNGMKISLILDHINGNNRDNKIENLRIVCPNCDAGLPTYKGKNNHKGKIVGE